MVAPVADWCATVGFRREVIARVGEGYENARGAVAAPVNGVDTGRPAWFVPPEPAFRGRGVGREPQAMAKVDEVSERPHFDVVAVDVAGHDRFGVRVRVVEPDDVAVVVAERPALVERPVARPEQPYPQRDDAAVWAATVPPTTPATVSRTQSLRSLRCSLRRGAYRIEAAKALFAHSRVFY